MRHLVTALLVVSLPAGCASPARQDPLPRGEGYQPGDSQPGALPLWCVSTASKKEQEQALIAALPRLLGRQSAAEVMQHWRNQPEWGTKGGLSCAHPRPVSESDALLVMGQSSSTGGAPLLYAWQETSDWQIAPFPLEEGSVWTHADTWRPADPLRSQTCWSLLAPRYRTISVPWSGCIEAAAGRSC